MLKIAVVGLGPIGVNCAKKIQGDSDFILCGLVDIDVAKLGKTLSDIDSTAQKDDVRVVADVDHLLDNKPDIAIISTTSYFDRLAPTLRQCIRHKINVVSSCEQMAWPWLKHPHLADVINAECKKAGITLVGTGVNPGFVMDLLPVVLASMLSSVQSVKVTRVVDALKRRMPLQRKIGSTMSVKQFKDLAKAGKIGHMGIGESVVMLAQGLGRHPYQKDVTTFLEPVIATRDIECALGTIKTGEVCGMHNVGKCNIGGLSIELDLTMAVAANDPRDEIELIGAESLRMIIPDSTPGDTATVASLLNVSRALPLAGAGLKTMLDLAPVGAKKMMKYA